MKVLENNLEFNVVENIIHYSQNQVIQKDKTFDVFEVGYEIDIIDNNDPTQKEDTNNVQLIFDFHTVSISIIWYLV